MATLSTGGTTSEQPLIVTLKGSNTPTAVAVPASNNLASGDNQTLSIGYDPNNPNNFSVTQTAGANSLANPANANSFESANFEIKTTDQAIKDAGTATKSGGGEGGTGTTEGGGTSGPKMKPCPDCGQVPGLPGPEAQGKQGTNKKKKTSNDTNSELPNQPFAGKNILQIAAAVLESIGNFFGNLMDLLEIKEGKCDTCGSKRQVEDKSDQTPEINKTVAAANAQKEKLTELESKASGGTGLGGNDIKLIVGSKFLKVGMAYNDSQSYESVPEGKDVPASMEISKYSPHRVSRKIAQVNGLNPLPTIGGNYTMEIGNHFKVRTGAQGIEFSTEGPFIVKAGQYQFIGPEVAIGTATGETRISGNHLQLDGESIAITPGRSGKGQAIVQGTLGVTGNIVAKGGAHIDGDLSFISGTCPFKEERTKVSSQETEFTGPARWSLRCAAQGARDLLRTLAIRSLDPSLIVVSARQGLNLLMDTKELGEKAYPLELQPTGLIKPGDCVVSIGLGELGVFTGANLKPIPIYNYPHHHTLTDMIHAHNYRGPNFNYVDDDEQTRSAAATKSSRSPVPITVSSALDKLYNAVRGVYYGTVALIQRIFD